MKILVNGAVGFNASTLILRLLARGETVVGIDKHNEYYDLAIKEARRAPAAGTKWNLRFRAGMMGGHCIRITPH